jgi:hypothetical protein
LIRIIIFSLLLIALNSCSRDRLTIYQYNESTITRIDKDAETYFYYGNYRNIDSLPKEYIIARYSGFNYAMASYLIFKKDKTVTFVNLGDGLEKVGNSKSINIFKHRDNIHFINWAETFESKYDSIIRIDDVLKMEREINKTNKSKVSATYFSTD